MSLQVNSLLQSIAGKLSTSTGSQRVALPEYVISSRRMPSKLLSLLSASSWHFQPLAPLTSLLPNIREQETFFTSLRGNIALRLDICGK